MEKNGGNARAVLSSAPAAWCEKCELVNIRIPSRFTASILKVKSRKQSEKCAHLESPPSLLVLTDEDSPSEDRSDLKASPAPGKRKKRRHRYLPSPLSLGHSA